MLVDFFPSTDGVFFISSNLIYTAQRFDMMFPSTDGVFFISSMLSATFLTIQSYCFRPLPGAFLFHLYDDLEMAVRACESFRPLPGAFLFHPGWEYNGNVAIYELFPSPAGGFFISSRLFSTSD